jgi:hypothetical protein
MSKFLKYGKAMNICNFIVSLINVIDFLMEMFKKYRKPKAVTGFTTAKSMEGNV